MMLSKTIKHNVQHAKQFSKIRRGSMKSARTSRKLHLPKNTRKWIYNPFFKEYKNKRFVHNMYTDMKPFAIPLIYVTNILRYSFPAILTHIGFALINYVSEIVLQEPQTMSTSMLKVLFILYGIAIVLGVRRANDHMASFRVELITPKHNINQTVLEWMNNGMDKTHEKEFRVMERYRQRYNKYILFPTTKELAMIEKLHDRALQRKSPKGIRISESRMDKLDFFSRTEEHYAAKDIADLKEIETGENEYKQMVRKYSRRTTPEYKELAYDVMYEKDLDLFDLDIELDLEDDSLFDYDEFNTTTTNGIKQDDTSFKN